MVKHVAYGVWLVVLFGATCEPSCCAGLELRILDRSMRRLDCRIRFLPSSELKGLQRPRRIGRNPFAWLAPIWTFSEEAVLQTSGYDAVVHLRILKFGE